MLADVVSAWKDHAGSLTAHGLGRVVKDADLKKYAMLAKKFAEGMSAQEPDTKITVADCLEEFASGSFDGYLHNVRDTSMSAFWPWVVQAKQERSKSEATSDLKAAQEAAAKLIEEQERLKQEPSQAEGKLLTNKTKIFDAC